MQSLVRAGREGRMDADVALVVANQADAAGLAWARDQGIPALLSPSRGRGEAHEREVGDAIEAARCDLVALAGYMRILSPAFVRRFDGRTVNIHPSLLPSFPGLDAQSQAHAAGVRVAGCTTHFVTERMDAGPPIVQAAVAVPPGATRDELAARILEAEHRIYPLTVHLLATGRARWDDGRVAWRGASAPPGPMLVSPEAP